MYFSASQNMGWLYSRNVPALAQMMLQEFPVLREDEGMMRGYMFLIDFLEAVAKETTGLLQKNQRLLRIILEAAKVSEDELNVQIQKYSDEVQYNLTSFLSRSYLTWLQ